MRSRCKATNKDGSPCSATPRSGRDWCRWHDPDFEARRQEERAAGGRARSNRSRARKHLLDGRMSPQEIEGLVCRALIRAMTDQITPGMLSAIAAGARAYVAVHTAAEVDERLHDVEEQIARLTPADARRVR